MEEQPVRKSNWMAVTSLCLGILGFITSFGFMLILDLLIPNLYRYLDFLPNWFDTFSLYISSFIGVIGLIVGIIGLERAEGKDRIAKFGIAFSALSIFLGLPLVLLFIILV